MASTTTTPIGGGGGGLRHWQAMAAAVRLSSVQRAGRAMPGLPRTSCSHSSGHHVMSAGLWGAPPLLPRAAAASFSRTAPLKGAALTVGFGRAAPYLLAAASYSRCSGRFAMPAGLWGGRSLLFPKAAAAASALAVGFGRAALLLAAASRSTNSGHLGMPAGLGVGPPLWPRPSAAASRTEGLKGAALPAGSGMAPLSGDGDLELSLDAKSDLLLQEVKGIHAKLHLISRALEETGRFRYMLKMITLKIMITLVLTSLVVYLVGKVAREIGYVDIDRFLKNLFITDKEVKAKLQEAINSHLDATFEHIVPWKKFKMWWWMNVGRFLSRKE